MRILKSESAIAADKFSSVLRNISLDSDTRDYLRQRQIAQNRADFPRRADGGYYSPARFHYICDYVLALLAIRGSK